jgi:xylulokinase
MEGVAMSVRHVLEICGVLPSAEGVVQTAGGATRLELWNQIRADVLGMGVNVIEQSNATTLGAAMLAAVGVGLYRNLSEAATMVRIQRTYTPNRNLTVRYNELYTQYRNLYELLKPVYTEKIIDPNRF